MFEVHAVVKVVADPSTNFLGLIGMVLQTGTRETSPVLVELDSPLDFAPDELALLEINDTVKIIRLRDEVTGFPCGQSGPITFIGNPMEDDMPINVHIDGCGEVAFGLKEIQIVQ